MDKSKKRILLIGGIALGAVILIAAAVFLLLWLFRPQLVLKEDVVIEAGTPLSAELLVSEVKYAEWADVTLTSDGDWNKPGSYEAVLTVGGERYTAPFTVVDTTAPVFAEVPQTLTVFAQEGLNEETLLAQLNLTAEDAQDVTFTLADLPADLTVPGTYTVEIIAADASNNEARASFTLMIEEPDTTAPTVIGADNTSFTVGGAFDPMTGVSAKDDRDANPTIRVISSNVDAKTVGTYTVVYEAKDASGNIAKHTRTVTVMAKAYIYTTAGGATWNAAGRSNQPYLVAVNRALCTVTVYGKDDNGNYTVPVKAFACSVGRSGHATPLMQVNSLDRYRWCLMVDGTWGQYAIRVRGGIMFHSVPYYSQDAGDLEYLEYNKLGSPASLGCIRMTVADVKWLYDNCPFAFPTVIYDDTVSPGPLGKPSTPKIDPDNEELRGWDPTDPNPKNPW